MALLTVDDLARDLKVKNEDLLRELVTLGYEVDSPESHLETDDPGALRAHLITALPQREVVEKRIKPTVIRRRMKKPPPAAKKDETLAEGSAEVADELAQAAMEEARATVEGKAPVVKPVPEKREPARKPKRRIKKVEPARIIEMAPRPPTPKLPVEPPPTEEAPPKEGEAPAEAAHVHPAPKPMEEALERLPKPQAVGADEVVGLQPEPEQVQEALRWPAEERRLPEDRALRKKKKKERKTQPAQIIGRVELRREPQRGAPPPETAPPATALKVVEPAEPPLETFVPEPSREEDKRRKRKKDKKAKDLVEEISDDVRLKVRRRKEVIMGADLYGDRYRAGRLRGKGKKTKQLKPTLTTPKASKRRLKIAEIVTVSTLAHRMSVKAAEVVRLLVSMGVTASVNEDIDFDTAAIIATEFGFEAEPAGKAEIDPFSARAEARTENLVTRPPVITVMGHVDHGKTSLLDAIRSTHVTDQEAGGITQHIGAYTVKLDKGELVFLDTPGHEAFTAMRARGANVTDFVVLVVAADDGVMEQTREAINHARAAKVPIIVAVNKMDKSDADPDRVMRQLSELDLVPETWGGDTLYTFVSAKTHDGLTDFLELILLQAEMMELKGNPKKTAAGTVIEARLDKGKGPVGTVLVQDGTLRLGDAFVAGTHYGKVRAMLDHAGQAVTEAGPATPVEVQGFAGVPEAGESFVVVDDEKLARQIREQRMERLREQEVSVATPASLEELLARMQDQGIKELDLVIKADVQGSVEAVREAILGISAQEVKVKVIHSGVGAVTESDVMLASASRAIIIGFNVRPTAKAAHLAEQEKVDVRLYTVIYEAIEDVRKAMAGLLEPIQKETLVGRAEVRQTFSIARVGVVAGCYVTQGKIERSNLVRLLRDGVIVYQGRIVSMKRFKDDVKEALEGYECGLVLENYRDIKSGDEIEAFIVEQESAQLI